MGASFGVVGNMVAYTMPCVIVSNSKITKIKGLSEALGPSVRELRTMAKNGIIPFYKTGHRSVWFDVEKVRRALQQFEVKAIGK